jgi:hypothetical protein
MPRHSRLSRFPAPVDRKKIGANGNPVRNRRYAGQHQNFVAIWSCCKAARVVSLIQANGDRLK